MKLLTLISFIKVSLINHVVASYSSLNGPTCPIGNPHPNIFCGRGPNSQACPLGYFCNIDPVDRFAVCCKEKTVPKCPTGIHLPNIFCGRGPNRQDCPSGYFCNIDPADRFAVCCKEKNICKHGKPFAPSGYPLPCQGPNAIRCPASFLCKVDSKHLKSACCPRAPKCKYGKYVKDIGQEPTCNPLAQKPCPLGYKCSETQTNELGFCCRQKNPCKRGEPLQENGDALHCIGPGKIDCPTGYECVGSANTSSVCCRKRIYKPYYGLKYGKCPKGKQRQNCHIDLCKVLSCPRVPNAKCRMEVCGECKDRWFVGTKDVTDICKQGAPMGQCPKDRPFSFCFISPCPGPNEPTKCPNFPKAECYGDQCGGCKARYFLNLDEKTDKCRKY